MNTRSRGWCFTCNNYTDDDIVMINDVSSLSQYLIYGKEVAGTGTPHLQGYIYFENAKSFSKVQKIMPRGTHLETQKGTAVEASDYCKKENEFKEFGTLPAQGKRSDIDLIKEAVASGRGMREIVDLTNSYQSIKMAEVLLKYKEKPRSFKPIVKWFYGSTGTGKTKTAYELLGEDMYVAMATGKWWEGYDAHKKVLIDDMRGDFMKFHELLRLLDRYAYKVETKGGSRQFLADEIIITSCFHPKDLFNTREDIHQLIRRIDEIKEFKIDLDV